MTQDAREHPVFDKIGQKDANRAAAEDFSTDPVALKPTAAYGRDFGQFSPKTAQAASAAPALAALPEDGPKDPEPEAAPVAAVGAPEHYPEASPDAPSRLPPAARPCRAGP